MGKMKELFTEMQENGQIDGLYNEQQDDANADVVSLQQEAHYVHTINEICELFVLHGWDKVWPDIQECMRGKKW
jgi:hypothetical protein